MATNDKFSGEVELFLQRTYLPVKNLPLSLVEQILEVPALTQEQINEGKIRTSWFSSYYEVTGDQIKIKFVGLSYDNYVKVYNLIKPYTTKSKIPRSKFK